MSEPTAPWISLQRGDAERTLPKALRFLDQSAVASCDVRKFPCAQIFLDPSSAMAIIQLCNDLSPKKKQGLYVYDQNGLRRTSGYDEDFYRFLCAESCEGCDYSVEVDAKKVIRRIRLHWDINESIGRLTARLAAGDRLDFETCTESSLATDPTTPLDCRAAGKKQNLKKKTL